MMLRRLAILLCLPLLLSACGDEAQAPLPPPRPASTPALPEPGVPPAAAQASIAPVAAPAKPQAATEPPASKEKATKPAAPLAARTPRKPHATPVPQPPVDLRLPHELMADLFPDKAPDSVPEKRLLPPMFIDRSSESPFQLNGKLLHKDRAGQDDDYWETVDGAELQFEFRR
ncbi:hypothetical protein D9M70_165590 [compost metagenome]